ncbi:nucleotidyltransferase domain-containing protein [bacterium]|nr:nucleotidyltransferase domain-containing protein [bacterium]
MKRKISQKMKKKLKELGVEIVVLFGSTVTSTQTSLSDIDIGVVFKNFEKIKSNIEKFYGEIFNLFLNEFKVEEEKLDLIFLQEAPLSLQYKAITEGEILYLQDPEFLANYVEHVLKYYFDFQPVEKEFYRSLIKAKLNT